MLTKDVLLMRGGGGDCGGDYVDGPEFEELVRLTGADCSADPYRCPVSTPAGYERTGPERDRNNPSYLSFTSLSHSFEMPRNLPGGRQQLSHRGGVNRRVRPQTKPQKKNFDCYFVEKAVRPVVGGGGGGGSGWLTSLCSQPVEEIFNKYKRRSDARLLAHRTPSHCRHVSTPGEKALVHAWTSNSSQRDSPSAMSRATHRTDRTRRSEGSNPTPASMHVYGYDTDPERLITYPGFALMPVPSPTVPEVDNTTWSSSGSVFNHETNKYINTCSNHVSENESATNVYDAYQRERRFPTIRRKKSLSPAKKRIPADPPIQHASSLPSGMNLLEESPIEIISVGSFHCPAEAVEEPVKPAAPSTPRCSYRLPKQPPSALPVLKGKG